MNTIVPVLDRSYLPQYLASVDQVADALRAYTWGLLGIDGQKAFVDGALGTRWGREAFAPTNKVARYNFWRRRQLTRDYHPYWHVSYVEIRSDLVGDPRYDTMPYDMTYDEFLTWTPGNMPIVQEAQKAGITYDNLGAMLKVAGFQRLWMRGRHACEGTPDSEFWHELDVKRWEGVTLKGRKNWVDSYSGFADNAGFGETNLDATLRQSGVNAVAVSLLCTEYCDKWTVDHAQARGYKVMVLTDCVRPVNVGEDDEKNALIEMHANGHLLVDNATLDAAVQLAKLN